MADDHFTKESEGKVGTITTEAEARAAHHLASADPEPERDGLMTGPAHEEKYGLERAEGSAEVWRAAGVHPTENRALTPGEEGYENLRGAAPLETADVSAPKQNTAAPKADSK